MSASKIFAASALLFSGMAAANYNMTGYNTTSPMSVLPMGSGVVGTAVSRTMHATSTPSSTLSPEAAFCKQFSGTGRTYQVGEVGFKIECNEGCNGGETIDIVISVEKRAAAAAGLPGCIAICEEASECTATSYNKDTGVCTYYKVPGSLIAESDVDFALVAYKNVPVGTATVTVGPNGQPITAPLVTSTVYEPSVHTIYSCASTVTDCPYRSVVTDMVAAYTTVCPGNLPVTATGAAVACTGCPSSPETLTAYSASVGSNGATSYVAVNTVVANVPTLTGAASATASVGLTTTVKVASATSSITAFTGAAHHVEAGMGMAALVGAAALLI